MSRQQTVVLLHYPLVKVHGLAVNGEHAAGLAYAHDLLTGELPVDVTRQGGQEGDILHMLLAVQYRLMQVGDGPALGDVEGKQLRQLRRRLARHGVAPGAEGRQQLAALEGQIAVHHARHAHSRHCGQQSAVFLLHVRRQLGIGVLHAVPYGLQGVGPYAVFVLVLPGVAAGGHGSAVLPDEHRLDPGGAKLDAQIRPALLNGFLYCCAHDVLLLIVVRAIGIVLLPALFPASQSRAQGEKQQPPAHQDKQDRRPGEEGSRPLRQQADPQIDEVSAAQQPQYNGCLG